MKWMIVGWSCCMLLAACKKDVTQTDSASRTSNAEAPPPVPANLRLDPTFTQTPFTARIIWDAPSGIDIMVYRPPATRIDDVVSAGHFTLFGRWQYTLNNLQQNTTYSISLQSQTFSGVRSAISETFTFTSLPTNDRIPPSAPVLQLQSQGPGYILANWTASTDNFDPSSELTYEIYNVLTGGLVIKLKGTQLQSSFDNVPILEDCVPYVVRARDRTGNLSGPSNAAKTLVGCK